MIGVCVLCYELCEFLYQCGRDSKQEVQDSTDTVSSTSSGVDQIRAVYTLPEPQRRESVENREHSS